MTRYEKLDTIALKCKVMADGRKLRALADAAGISTRRMQQLLAEKRRTINVLPYTLGVLATALDVDREELIYHGR